MSHHLRRIALLQTSQPTMQFSSSSAALSESVVPTPLEALTSTTASTHIFKQWTFKKSTLLGVTRHFYQPSCFLS
ncbi:uncharacterized protein LOC122510528 isoform X2 [Leptopilina heterotoma]|uniref:uncharacterized protein LOC122510528 isoform X2 n=1 Tax=Leptopilina heterotoma TaxID=63436 RepID=UPI001CAA0194|nr:uncharacterized protein LOC122510528 isoform X2 [Leptopilina heterotoma]